MGEPDQPLASRAVFTMAVVAAVTVANLYYNQPLLGQMAQTFHRPAAVLGLVTTLTQGGYAVGLLLFVPLADLVERRRLILILLAAAIAAVLAESVAADVLWLELAAAGIGMATVVPQVVLPVAADLAPEGRRGRIVGFVMSGLLIGILAARTVAGAIASWLGWRAVFRVAAALMVVMALLVAAAFPRSRPHATALGYRQTLASLWPLFRSEPELASAAITGAALFGAFSGFWTALTFLLKGPPFHFAPIVIGLFGLAGVAGASVAPVAGRFADRRDARLTVTLALAGSALSLIWMGCAPRTVWAIVAGIVVLDLATQAGQISNQSRIYALRAHSRGRLNTVYMVTYFIGGALGSGAASLAWSLAGWRGVTAAGLIFLFGGAMAHRWGYLRAGPHRRGAPKVDPAG